MRRKNWVSLVCGGLLLAAVALPARAAGGVGPGHAPVLVERLTEWLQRTGWLSAAPPSQPRENRIAAGGKNDPPAPPPAPTCELCNDGEMDGTADPDG